ncbi:GntR family transcriptional regulator, partial [Chloroflexota bacterium]
MNEATLCQSGEPSQASQAYELIKAELLSCTIRPGARVVQRELAERYKLGLTPIREALQRLSQDGYLTPVPRMGYTVSTIRLRDLRELYDLREILEGAAARWAAERATTEQLAKIQELAQ